MTQSLWFLDAYFRIIADHRATGGQYDLIEGYFPAGTQTPLHRHTRHSEQIYLLEGEFTAWAGEQKAVLKAGESFLIQTGIPHTVAALSSQPARMLVVAAPSGFARLIAETGTLEREATPDMALMERISAEIGDEILGPPGTYPTHSEKAVN